MHYTSLVAAILAAGAAGSATAQEKVFGEVGLSYGQTSADDIDETLDAFSIHGAGAFVSAMGLGIQIGGSYTNLSVEDGGDLDTYTIDGHVYGDLGNIKVGAFIGSTELDELDIYGLGAADLSTTITTYGVEGQGRSGPLSYHGYAGVADVEDLDVLETTIYGLGAGYDIGPSVELSADFDGAILSVDGSSEDLEITTLSVGVDYYTAFASAPIRLSASIGRSTYDIDGFQDDTTSIAIGATYLFGGTADASREDLFDAFQLPF